MAVSTVSSPGTGTLSSAGIGSGLDVNGIITSIMGVEKQPLLHLQADASAMQTKLSAVGQMQSMVSSFRDALTPLTNAASFAVTSSASSDPTTVTASSTATAVPGAYSVSVSALASTQTTVSAAGQFSAGTDVVGTGSITLSLGTWGTGQTTFTAKPGTSDVVIPIDATAHTLAGIRDKINAANAGVSATIVTDANGARLALQSSSTGAANGFRVKVTDADGNNTDALGLSRLAFDPASGVTQMTQTQAATNTQASINGIAVTTAGNSLTDVVGGMTFNLSKVTTTPVTVNVTQNTDAVKAMLTSFVTAYNALAGFLTSSTQYDPTTKTAAVLQGDATTTGLQNQLRSMVSQGSSASATFGSLSSMGIQFQKDGTLTLDDTKVGAALQNLPELTKALSNVDLTTPANNGIAKKIDDWANGLLASNGSLTGETQSIQSEIKSNQNDQDAMNIRLTATEARIRAQYTALDTAMSQANSLAQYVNQQITTWNAKPAN